MSTETLYCLMPEVVLVAAATLIYIGGVFVPGRRVWSVIATGAILLAGAMLYGQYKHFFWGAGDAVEPAFTVLVPGPLAVDLFGQYVRWLVLVIGLAFVLMASRPAADVQAPEYMGTLVLAVAGLMLVAAARELVLLFLGLELISIPTYVLLYLGRRSIDSQEATAKYFFLSVVSSAVMLYGFSFLYGAAGSTDLLSVRGALEIAGGPTGIRWFARLALVLIFAGLAFKFTAVPFHFYAPDVYQGTTNGNAAVLSFLPKLGGLVALVRIVAVAMPGYEMYAWRIALVVALLTMTLGNVVALWQTNIRRMLAYSSIAHGGYMLIGLAVALAAASGADAALGFDGVGGMLYYATVYALATTGAFAALVYLAPLGREIDNVADLTGVGRTHPWVGTSMAVFMFSLTGIPPMAGFWGKLNLFAGAVSVRPASGAAGDLRWWFLALAVIGVLNAVISAGYYLRIVSVMYFRPAGEARRAQGGAGAGVAMLLCLALVMVAGAVPNPLQVGANAASQSARMPVVAPAVPEEPAADLALAERALDREETDAPGRAE